MMREVEGLLGVKAKNEDYRRSLISSDRGAGRSITPARRS
jgi:hypothetical protein